MPELGRDLLRRLRTLLVPMLVIGLVYSLFANGSIRPFFRDPMKCGYWYLLVLFECYLCHYLLMLKRRFSRALWTDLLFAVVLYLCLKLTYLYVGDNRVTVALSLVKWAGMYPWFFMGTLVGENRLFERICANKWVCLFSVLGCIVLTGLYFYTGIRHISRLTVAAWVLTVMCVMVSLKETDNRLLHTLAYWGSRSMDIYVFHFFWLCGLNFSIGAWMHSHLNPLFSALLIASLSIPVLYASLLTGRVLRTSSLLETIVFGKRSSARQMYPYSEQYAVALSNSQAVRSGQIADPILQQLLQAQTLITQDNWREADRLARKVMKQCDPNDEQQIDLYRDAEWLHAQCLMHRHRPLQARRILKRIAADETNHYQPAAQEILDNIK